MGALTRERARLSRRFPAGAIIGPSRRRGRHMVPFTSASPIALARLLTDIAVCTPVDPSNARADLEALVRRALDLERASIGPDGGLFPAPALGAEERGLLERALAAALGRARSVE